MSDLLPATSVPCDTPGEQWTAITRFLCSTAHKKSRSADRNPAASTGEPRPPSVVTTIATAPASG